MLRPLTAGLAPYSAGFVALGLLPTLAVPEVGAGSGRGPAIWLRGPGAARGQCATCRLGGGLARPTRRQLEAGLLYPAFAALSLLVIQSFDRSVLTVLLMLEVLALFSTSLLLRRPDLR